MSELNLLEKYQRVQDWWVDFSQQDLSQRHSYNILYAFYDSYQYLQLMRAAQLVMAEISKNLDVCQSVADSHKTAQMLEQERQMMLLSLKSRSLHQEISYYSSTTGMRPLRCDVLFAKVFREVFYGTTSHVLVEAKRAGSVEEIPESFLDHVREIFTQIGHITRARFVPLLDKLFHTEQVLFTQFASDHDRANRVFVQKQMLFVVRKVEGVFQAFAQGNDPFECLRQSLFRPRVRYEVPPANLTAQELTQRDEYLHYLTHIVAQEQKELRQYLTIQEDEASVFDYLVRAAAHIQYRELETILDTELNLVFPLQRQKELRELLPVWRSLSIQNKKAILGKYWNEQQLDLGLQPLYIKFSHLCYELMSGSMLSKRIYDRPGSVEQDHEYLLHPDSWHMHESRNH